MGLTLKAVERAKQKPGRYCDQFGLYLEVRRVGRGSWLFRFQRDGRERWMGLGAVSTFNLLEARERARKARQQLADGIDPLDARRAETAQRALAVARNKTFKECTEEFFDANSTRWRNPTHRAQWLSSLEQYAFPVIGNLAVAEIDVGLVLRVFEKKWDHLGGETFWNARQETARRVLGRIEKVLAWATVRGLRTGDNPARWQGFLATQLPPKGKVTHHAALPYGELPGFLVSLRDREGVAARALEFTVLTAARTGAVIGSTWDEVDLKEKVWTVPPDRAGTKIDGTKPRRVPLSPRAVEILEALPRERDNPHVFIGPREGRGLSNAAMATVLKRMNREDITVHGFRSTFKDWVSERTNYPNHVSEAALWHVVADKVEAAYRRGDLFEKRRRLMADWARYCLSTAAGGEVVPIREAAE